jgi:hypothetical protein
MLKFMNTFNLQFVILTIEIRYFFANGNGMLTVREQEWEEKTL